MAGKRLNGLVAKLAVVLGFDGGLHDLSEGVAAALEDVHPCRLVYPHFGYRSAMHGLLGVVVFNKVDGKPVLVNLPHGDGWAGRDRRVVSQCVRELYYLYSAKPDGLSFLGAQLKAGDCIIVYGFSFFIR